MFTEITLISTKLASDRKIAQQYYAPRHPHPPPQPPSFPTIEIEHVDVKQAIMCGVNFT